MNILVPKTLDLITAAKFSRESDSFGCLSEITLDFSPLHFSEPMGMLVFASAIRRLRSKNVDLKITALNHEAKPYQAHMGFFKSFGVDFGKGMGEAGGNVNYVPITQIRVNDLHTAAEDTGASIHQVIEGDSIRLATMLAMGRKNVREVLSYSIREMIRNTVEHSSSRFLWLSAQAWTDRDLIEVSLLDEGVGIGETLKRNPNLSITTDGDALKLAIEPGVSGAVFLVNGKLNLPDGGINGNSGFGLYLVSSLCNTGGSFALLSGQSVMVMEAAEKQFSEGLLNGTAVRLRLKPSRLRSLDQALEALIKAGEEKARSTGNVSKMSSARSISK